MRSSRADDGLEYLAAIEGARRRLGPLASTFVFLPAAASTNDVALARCEDRGDAGADPHGLVVVADEQTAGRGRRGHTWFSPPRAGLYVSVVLAPASARVDPPRATTLVTLTAGVAMAEGIAAAEWARTVLGPGNRIGADRINGVLMGSYGDQHLVTIAYDHVNVAIVVFASNLGVAEQTILQRGKVQYLVVDDEINMQWRERVTSAGVKLLIAEKDEHESRGASAAAK